MIESRRRALIAGAALAALPWTAAAQAFPDRAVRLTVGFPPGTGPDVVARLLGARLAELLKQQVVVDNKAGAGGQIAAQAVAKSAPDGYSLLLGEVGSISIAPPAFSKLPYDPAKELVGLSEVVRSDFLLVVPANSPHTNVADLIKASKAKADKVNMATFGAGTPGHFGAGMFAEAAGFKVEPIHYRAEAGLPKIDFSAWFAVFAPAGTPPAALDLLSRQIVAALQTPETKAKLVEAGFSVLGTSRADTERMLKAEAQRWAAVVTATGFKGD
jgi:tripartite-type tricarboxylate transporter receptor subunit TctC